MSVNPRLADKLAQALAHRGLRRSPSVPDARAFADDLAARCASGDRFEVLVDERRHLVDPEFVRVSGSVVDLGLHLARVRIPLGTVCPAEDGDGERVPGAWEFETTDEDDPPIRTLRHLGPAQTRAAA